MDTKTQPKKTTKVQIAVDRELVARAQRAQGFRYLTAAALVRGLLAECIERAGRPAILAAAEVVE